jgi:hypothetical protein
MTLEFTCKCGVEWRAEYEPLAGLPNSTTGRTITMPGVPPRILRHCAEGDVVASAASRLARYQEKRQDRWVDATPYLSEF